MGLSPLFYVRTYGFFVRESRKCLLSDRRPKNSDVDSVALLANSSTDEIIGFF